MNLVNSTIWIAACFFVMKLKKFLKEPLCFFLKLRLRFLRFFEKWRFEGRLKLSWENME